MTKPELIICNTPAHFNSAKKLSKDYMDWLGLDLHYQGIDNEFKKQLIKIYSSNIIITKK